MLRCIIFKSPLASRFFPLPLFRLFNQVHQAFNFRSWWSKYSVKLFIRVMVFQKLIDIHPLVPAADYPSTGKHVILGTAVLKIDLAAYPGAPNYLIIVLFNQFFCPLW